MASTATIAQFESGHVDMVHDAEFDYYGKRLATCSSDRTIKIFEVSGEQVSDLSPDLAQNTSASFYNLCILTPTLPSPPRWHT
jgi:WD40 repeat protein